MEKNSSNLFTRAANEVRVGIKVSLQKCGHAGKRSQLTGSTQQNCSFFPEGYFVNLNSADRTAFAFSWEK